MALRRFLGQAVARTNVWTATISTATVSTVVGVASPTGNEVTVTAGSGATTSTLATALAAALAQSTAPEFREYSWSANAAVVTGTATTPGRPGTFTATGTGGATTLAEAVTATGPNDGLNVDNWSGGALPTTSDDVLFDGSSAPLLYGLSVFDSVALASFTIDNFGGEIGLPPVNTGNGNIGGRYPEYRRRDIRLVGGFPVIIGRGATRPTRVVLRVGSTATDVQVLGTSSGGAATANAGGSTGVYLTTTGTGHTLSVAGGQVEVATLGGDVATFASIRASGNSTVNIGAGATVTELINQQARTSSYVALSDLEMTASAISHHQYAGNLTAVVRGGELHYSTSGTLTVTATGSKSVVNLSGDPRAKTVHSSSSILHGAKMIDPNKTRGSSSCTFDSTSLPASQLGDAVTCS